MTGSAGTLHASFDHEAIFYDDPGELSSALAPTILGALDRHESVLVSLTEDRWDLLARHLGDRARHVAQFPAGDRYARPPVAFAMLHKFVTEAVASGARTVWSIGEIAFTGSLPDEDWLRYEQAVTDLLCDLPLRAVCAYDTSALAAEVLDGACITHLNVQGHRDEDSDLKTGRPPRAIVAPAMPMPAGRPLVDRRDPADIGELRAAVRATLTGQIPRTTLDDVELVVSELATNATGHGTLPTCAKVWLEAGAVTVTVADAGGGPPARYPELRAPDGRVGGLGLWISGQVADRLHFAHDSAGWTATATFWITQGVRG
ncbi:MAG: sensor histidine kinase [Actinomycetota bacterium]|nr:sensor histidine kinase [Actinomycetota bacterium]